LISEKIPITQSENNGTYAEVVEYSNGIIRLEIYGTGGVPFALSAGYYDIDYPSFLKLNIDKIPDNLILFATLSLQQDVDIGNQ
jgi:hypothetical protein